MSETTPHDVPESTPRGRRELLRQLAVAGAGAAAGAAGAVVAGQTSPAAAANGQPILAAVSNDATAPTLVSWAAGPPLGDQGASVLTVGEAAPGTGPADAVPLFPAAVGGYGVAKVANGVHGSTRSASGYGVVAANAAAPTPSQPAPVALALAALGAHVRFLPPSALGGDGQQIGVSTAQHTAGELVIDDAFNLWYSVPVAGAQIGWVKLAGRDTAGSFHPLPVPLRAYDSRTGSGPAASGEGPMTGGQERTLDITVGFEGDSPDLVDAVPQSATAAALNITVVDTVGSGFLAVYAGGLPYPGTSNINWSGAGQITANFAIAATSVNGEITVHAGGNGSANVIVDVTGYYR